MSLFLKTMMFHIIIGSTLMGMVVIALLVANQATAMTLIIGSLAGFIVAGPISWIIAKRLN